MTSLRDGMNLVSYEYVACQSQNAGAPPPTPAGSRPPPFCPFGAAVAPSRTCRHIAEPQRHRWIHFRAEAGACDVRLTLLVPRGLRARPASSRACCAAPQFSAPPQGRRQQSTRSAPYLHSRDGCRRRCHVVSDAGVLVLSEFAGAAQSLGAGAILVNPWNITDMAAAIEDALTMSEQVGAPVSAIVHLAFPSRFDVEVDRTAAVVGACLHPQKP